MVRDRGATPRPDPPFASQEILQLMKGCCKKEPHERLTFPQIHAMLQILLLRDANIEMTSPSKAVASPMVPDDVAATCRVRIQVEIHRSANEEEEDEETVTPVVVRSPEDEPDYVNWPIIANE